MAYQPQAGELQLQRLRTCGCYPYSWELRAGAVEPVDTTGRRVCVAWSTSASCYDPRLGLRHGRSLRQSVLGKKSRMEAERISRSWSSSIVQDSYCCFDRV
jgi:hypothetical protein